MVRNVGSATHTSFTPASRYASTFGDLLVLVRRRKDFDDQQRRAMEERFARGTCGRDLRRHVADVDAHRGVRVAPQHDAGLADKHFAARWRLLVLPDPEQ